MPNDLADILLFRRRRGGAAGPKLSLLFQNALDSRVTFTRAGAEARYFGPDGLLKVAGQNTPRFDHDPDTLRWLGLLIEGSRTNVALWNRDLTNAAWTKTDCVAERDQTGIDGEANTASSLEATDADATCLQTITLASSARTQTAYVKRLAGSGAIRMTTDGGTTWTTVTVTSRWRRVRIPAQTLANPHIGFCIVTSGDKIAVDYVQNENGAFPSSPIYVTSAAVTRGADMPAMTGDNFASWFNAAEGTFVVHGSNFCETGSANVVVASAGASTDRIQIYRPSSSLVGAAVAVSNSLQVNSNIGTGVALNTEFRAVFAYRADDFAGAVNGNAEVTDTAGALPTCNKLSIGTSENGASSYLFGHIKRIDYYDRRVGDLSDLSVVRFDGPFPYLGRPGIDVGAMQGVAASSGLFFTSALSLAAGNRTVRTYDRGWSLLSTRDTQVDNGAAHAQTNGLYFDSATNKLYCGANNFPAEPKLGWILEYDVNLSTGVLAFVGAHSVGPAWTEGCTKHGGYFWVVYHDLNEIHQYSADWTLLGEHALTSEVDPVDTESNPNLWQGIVFVENVAFINMHGANPRAPRIDAHEWNGTGFTPVAERLLPPTHDCSQGFAADHNGVDFWWAQRLGNDPNAAAQVIRSRFDQSLLED